MCLLNKTSTRPKKSVQNLLTLHRNTMLILILLQDFQIQMRNSQQINKNVSQMFDPTSYIVNGLSKSDVLQIKDAFDLLDTSGSGKLDPIQLKNLVKAFAFENKNQSLELAVQQITTSNKSVDFSTFLSAFTAFSHTPKTKAGISKIFKLFDDEKLGCISAKNLRRVVKQLQLAIDETQIQEMIDRADINNDGVITEDEFYLILTKISSKV